MTDQALTPPLHEAWVYKAKHAPRPAWPGPARRDGWHKVDNLKPRVIFDWAFHVVAGDGAVYFGSSADDKVYCLDAGTGRERWSFFTDGPVRLAPTLADGCVYVGSDDGVVYCLNATDGSLRWKHRAAPGDVRVPGNGRIMSLWPVRTGVLVNYGVAYFAAGLFTVRRGVHLRVAGREWGRGLGGRGLVDGNVHRCELIRAVRGYWTGAGNQPRPKGVALVWQRYVLSRRKAAFRREAYEIALRRW